MLLLLLRIFCYSLHTYEINYSTFWISWQISVLDPAQICFFSLLFLLILPRRTWKFHVPLKISSFSDSIDHRSWPMRSWNPRGESKGECRSRENSNLTSGVAIQMCGYEPAAWSDIIYENNTEYVRMNKQRLESKHNLVVTLIKTNYTLHRGRYSDRRLVLQPTGHPGRSFTNPKKKRIRLTGDWGISEFYWRERTKYQDKG